MSLPLTQLAPPRPQDLHPVLGDLALRRGRVHELCGPSRRMLAARVMARGAGPVVWARPAWAAERLNPAGLQPLADPARLILVAAARDEGLLWAMEEALRSGAVPLVVAELAAPPGLTLVRRLHLAAGAGAEAAARAGQVAPLGLILTPGGGAPGVESRWHLAPLPSPALLWSGSARWRLERLRARLAPPAAWQVTVGPDGAASLALLPAPDPAPDLAPDLAPDPAPDQDGTGRPRDPG